MKGKNEGIEDQWERGLPFEKRNTIFLRESTLDCSVKK